MIITKDFLLLNYPKTGTTFARRVIKRAYSEKQTWLNSAMVRFGLASPPLTELILPKLRPNGVLDETYQDQHGKVRQIPEQYADRDLVSIIRDPIERYLSMYHFRRWINFTAFTGPEVKEKYPHYPNLSFDEYLQWLQTHAAPMQLPVKNASRKYGYQTATFIGFFFKDPVAVVKSIERGDDDFMEELRKIRFLRQESLNDDLCSLLSGYGFSSDELDFIEQSRRMNESQNSTQKTEVSEQSIALIHEYDGFIYKVLEELAID